MQKRLIQCEQETNQTFWLVNNQKNSQIANQMWALDCNIWMCWKFVRKIIASVLSRFSFNNTTTIQQLKNSSNNKKIVKSTAFWLSVWKKWCLEKGLPRKLKITNQLSLTLCLSGSALKLKTNEVKPRKQWFHFIESDSDTDWTIPWTI